MRLAAQPRLTALVSLIALAAIATPALADPYVSASASVTNLRYRLIDLDPTDGIAPSATLSGSGILHVSSTNQTYGPPDVETTTPIGNLGVPFPIAHETSLGYSASIAGDTVTAMATAGAGNGPVLTNKYSGADMGLDYDILYYQQTQGRSSEVLLGDSSGAGFGPAFSIELGANTGIVFEGTATTSVWLDLQAAEAFTAAVQTAIGQPSTPSSFGGYSLLNGTANVAINLQNATFGDNGGVTTRGTSFQLGAWLQESLTSVPGPSAEQRLTQDFLLDYWNLGASGTTVKFFLSTSASAGATMENSFTVAIPEPGTWALMGLGLAGVALARRRHQG